MKIGEDLLIDYLSGELDAAQQQQVEEALAESAELQRQYETLKALMDQVGEMELDRPSAGLKRNFDAWLAEEKRGLNNSPQKAKIIPLKNWRRTAVAAAAVLILGIFIGIQVQTQRMHQSQIAAIQEELEETRGQMESLLAAGSTTKRLQAVNMSMELPRADQEMLDQLIELIHKDESSNVRLAAIEALLQFDQGETVQRALTSALRIEDKPVVQIALIHALVKIKAKDALPVLDELIEQEDTFDKVKDEARLGKFKLS